jgi:hypothetical protein
MTETQAARFLIDELPAQIDRVLLEQEREDTMIHGKAADGLPTADGLPANREGAREKISAVANRIALQIFSVPSLQSFLANYGVFKTDRNDGSVRIELDFLKLPKEIIPELEKLLSVDQFKDHKLVKYIKDGTARTGLVIEVTPKNLPGAPYDYAF